MTHETIWDVTFSYIRDVIFDGTMYPLYDGVKDDNLQTFPGLLNILMSLGGDGEFLKGHPICPVHQS